MKKDRGVGLVIKKTLISQLVPGLVFKQKTHPKKRWKKILKNGFLKTKERVGSIARPANRVGDKKAKREKDTQLVGHGAMHRKR